MLLFDVFVTQSILWSSSLKKIVKQCSVEENAEVIFYVIVQLFDWMQRHGKLNFASYSSFIKYMGISRSPIKALKVYDSIPDKSMKINVSVCNSILGCMVMNGRFESSMRLFEQMKDDGLLPDLVTYSTVWYPNSYSTASIIHSFRSLWVIMASLALLNLLSCLF